MGREKKPVRGVDGCEPMDTGGVSGMTIMSVVEARGKNYEWSVM